MPRYYGAFQSTILGRAIRIASGNRLLKYKDEVHVPVQYTKTQIEKSGRESRLLLHSYLSFLFIDDLALLRMHKTVDVLVYTQKGLWNA